MYRLSVTVIIVIIDGNTSRLLSNYLCKLYISTFYSMRSSLLAIAFSGE